MSSAASRGGHLLEGVSLHDEQADTRKFARILHRFGRRLLRAESPQDLYDLVLRTMAQHVRARIGVLALYVPDEKCLRAVATVGYPLQIVEHIRIAPGEGVLGRVYLSSRALVGGPFPGPRRRLRYHTEDYLAVPIQGNGRVLGVAAVTDRDDGNRFSHADVQSLRLLANPAGLALNAERVRQMLAEASQVASTDSLTGLLNRRYFDERLDAELQRAWRTGEPFALLMVDLDQFKAINDTFGHIRGDQVLRSVADRLRRCVRLFDVCTRYGGDEFAVLMPASSPETALRVGERIADAARLCSTDDFRVTVSIGIALSSGADSDVLLLADRALIEAKRAGKNTVRIQR